MFELQRFISVFEDGWEYEYEGRKSFVTEVRRKSLSWLTVLDFLLALTPYQNPSLMLLSLESEKYVDTMI